MMVRLPVKVAVSRVRGLMLRTTTETGVPLSTPFVMVREDPVSLPPGFDSVADLADKLDEWLLSPPDNADVNHQAFKEWLREGQRSGEFASDAVGLDDLARKALDGFPESLAVGDVNL